MKCYSNMTARVYVISFISSAKVLVIDFWELVPGINSAGAPDPHKKSLGFCILAATILAHLPKGKNSPRPTDVFPKSLCPLPDCRPCPRYPESFNSLIKNSQGYLQVLSRPLSRIVLPREDQTTDVGTATPRGGCLRVWTELG